MCDERGVSKFRIVVLAVVLLVAGSVQRLFAQGADPNAKSRLQERTFQSSALGRPMHYRILLPAGYFGSTKSYPVLYLLHGWAGDYKNWSSLTNLTYYAKDLSLIIVMPDAGNSWYVDSATVPQDKFDQYIVRDLISEIDGHWRTLRSRQQRAIAGLSMGGYGALKFALRYPDTFSVAASTSGALNAADTELGASRSDLQPSLVKVFGPENSKVRADNDVYSLAKSADPKSAPYLYLDCGSSDTTFLPPNRKFAALLSERKFSYEYHEYPGAHTWTYWNARLPQILKVVLRHIGQANEAADVKTSWTPVDDSEVKDVAKFLPQFPYEQGWLGADDAYSIPISPTKSIWLFGDTFVSGPENNVRSNYKAMPRNSVGISDCEPDKPCTMQYYWSDEASPKPRSFFDTGRDDVWYWPLDGYFDGSTLYFSLMVVRNKKGAKPEDAFGFEIAGTKWAVVRNPLANPDQWHVDLTDLSDEKLWPGSSIFADGQYVYLYTQVVRGEGKGYMTVFRTPRNEMVDPAKNWEYLGKDNGWHGGLPDGDAKPVIEQAISEMSVRYHPEQKKWVAISPGPELFTGHMIARTSDSPLGPWSAPVTIFDFPEMNPKNSIYDKDTFCYATKEHTEFGNSKMVITYACNSLSLQKTVRNMGIYRPEVVVLDLPDQTAAVRQRAVK